MTLVQFGLSVAVCIVLTAILFTIAYRWRLRMLRTLQGDLMHLVRERTEQLEEANRKLAAMSYVDVITDVANRRSFDEELAMEWRRSTRTRSHLSLLMVDIDGFKAFNDALGHQAGDACLRTVAAAISACVHRAADRVARYGGEEFVVLLPDTDGPGAAILGERIRAAVEQQQIAHPTMVRGRLTVSVGVATVSGKETTESDPSRLVRAADAALYQAKRDGRNLVRVAEPAAGVTP
jgi:diguanylate cyclase (GGDEF)-like protein